MAKHKPMFDRQYVAGVTATITVTASACCFGWAAPTMKYLVDQDSETYMTSSQISWMLAVIEVGNFISPLPSALFADKFGRKPVILSTGPMYAISWFVLLFSTNYALICTMRVLQGLAMGIVFTVVPTYLGEISSPSKRGSITGLFSTAWFFGYLLEYLLGPYLSYEVFTAVTGLIPCIFTILFTLQPESPYFYLTKAKEDEAFSTLTWLRNGSSPEDIRSELEQMKLTVQEDLRNPPALGDVVDSPADRRALLFILIVGSTRILSGGIAIMSYSTQLFTQTGGNYLSPDILTIIMGLVMFLAGFVNTFIVDSLGRRPLILFSCIGSFISMFAVTIYFYVESLITPKATLYNFIVPLAIITYCTVAVIGIYPVSTTYISELFTTKTRNTASSISAMVTTLCSFICIKLYQIIGDACGLYTIFFIFSMVCLTGLLLIFIYAPETRGKTFSEIRRDLCRTTEGNVSKREETSNNVH